jgi:transcriptional regulator with XRE-family HTH domain
MMTRLETIVRDRMAALDLSFERLASLTGIPRSTLHKLASGQTVRPRDSGTFDRLGKALRVSPALLREAAADAAGLHVYSTAIDDDTRVLMGSIEQLTPEQRAQVEALVEAMLRARDGHDRAGR